MLLLEAVAQTVAKPASKQHDLHALLEELEIPIYTKDQQRRYEGIAEASFKKICRVITALGLVLLMATFVLNLLGTITPGQDATSYLMLVAIILVVAGVAIAHNASWSMFTYDWYVVQHFVPNAIKDQVERLNKLDPDRFTIYVRAYGFDPLLYIYDGDEATACTGVWKYPLPWAKLVPPSEIK